MNAFRSTDPVCTRCGAPRADSFSKAGDVVCRACVVLVDAEARLAAGKKSGRLAAVMAIVAGVLIMLVATIIIVPSLADALNGPAQRWGSKADARLLGLAIGVGIVLVAGGVTSLRRLEE